MTLRIERFQPEGMNVRMSGGQPSYSHVVTVSGTGKIVYIAGQLARDIDGNCVGKGDMRAQMEQTFKRIPEVWRCPDAIFRRGHPDQHDRRRHPPSRSRFLKLGVQFSRTQLSRRRSSLSGNGRDHRD